MSELSVSTEIVLKITDDDGGKHEVVVSNYRSASYLYDILKASPKASLVVASDKDSCIYIGTLSFDKKPTRPYQSEED